MSSRSPLDHRKRDILKAVVVDYVRTAEPVGSRTLLARHSFDVRAATIRSEMAELAELGYLCQPHTSAGRIPSDMGYRFYVDRLMESAYVRAQEARIARDRLESRRSEMDIILHETCRILSDLAQYTSLATRPALKNSAISHISVAKVGRGKLLVVIVLDNGSIFHQLLELDPKSAKLDPIAATNYLTVNLAGRSLDSLTTDTAKPLAQAPPDLTGLYDRVLEFITNELEAGDDTDVHLEGASYIMQQPEFKEIDRLEAVLSVLEERSALYKLFSSVYLGSEVTVIIGAENPLSQMWDCSFVGTKYTVAGRVAGTIGVVGPTRMNYRRAVAAVELMATNLSDLLTQLSLS